MGVKVTDIYWTLGDHDGVLIFEAPDDETATTLLLHLGAVGNVHTTTCGPSPPPRWTRLLPRCMWAEIRAWRSPMS